MKIQYISDIHLETRNKNDFKSYLIPNAPYLALCGDIGYPMKETFKEFIEYCSKNWEQVFYVTGNHDYYNNIYTQWKYKAPYSMNYIEYSIEKLFESYPNVHYLQKKQYDIPNTNYSILGCTLWVEIATYRYVDCLTYLNDTKYISIDGVKRLSPEDIDILHEDHCHWLMKKLEHLESVGRKAIVLSHHLPTELLINDEYKNDPRNYLFFSELTRHLESKALQAWICGHSHSSKRILLKNNVELMMNCKGYSNEEIKNFNPSCIYEIHEKLNINLGDQEIVDFI
jgi:predicted MPP superfamily phosphohydrolase